MYAFASFWFTAASTPWSRQGGAICSISLLLLGAALVVYGGALMTVGHKPLQEGEVLDVQLQPLVLARLYRHT